MERPFRLVIGLNFLLTFGLGTVSAQKPGVSGTLAEDLREFVQTPAVPGCEQELAGKIAARLKTFSPTIDAQSNVTVTLGKGSPHRLIVAPIDEPGFVVSGITPEGYLTLQRLPQGGNLPLFNELYAAQPVKVGTPQGKWIDGSVAGLSIHLQPQRQHAPAASDLDNMFVDTGASSAAEARASGVDVLSPLTIERRLYPMGFGKLTAPAIGDRFGAAALVEVARNLSPAKIKGAITFAFVTQQWAGARGLQRLLYEVNPDELIYVGRSMRATPGPGQHEAEPAFKEVPGSGVLIASDQPGSELVGFASELKVLASQNGIELKNDYSAPLLPRGGYMLQPKLPDRALHLAIATSWPSTPAEVIQSNDLGSLVSLLELYLSGQAIKPGVKEVAALPEPSAPKRPSARPSLDSILKRLIETYAVSNHEANMREAVKQLLPPWAKPETDSGGNLILHLPSGSGSQPQHIAVVAHMDEIGYEVHSILPDGHLELESKGGGILAYFLGHAALVHARNGMHPGVLELPQDWEKPGFQWPRGQRETFRMDVGAQTPEQVAELGVKPGDFVTIPKSYRKLLGTKASARALDDRVGCAALVAAAWELGDKRLSSRNDVTFIWSTREELGLEGAAVAAKDMAAQDRAPNYVFAIDTFVSSDSPLESKRFADAVLGKGFVVRAVDNSNIVPRTLADKVVSMSRANGIAAQYGVTGGGNDGATFLLYGTTDIALGWPLRYAHSPGEVIDVRDLDGLSKIITAIARGW
jgi:putative aminopeptidase FrvX